MSEQTKSKTPFTDKKAFDYRNQYEGDGKREYHKYGDIVDADEVRKLEAVKIQLEEAIKKVFAAECSPEESVTACLIALKQSEDLNNDQQTTIEEKLIQEIPSKLWEVSKLRHALFTPVEFPELCRQVLRQYFLENPLPSPIEQEGGEK